MPGGEFRYDRSKRPLTVATFAGTLTNEQFEGYLKDVERQLDRAELYVTILDARRSTITPPRQRRRQAQWLEENESRLRKYCIGCAFVISSPLVRGILTAILWMQPMPIPHVVLGTMDEALAWAQQQCQWVGLPWRNIELRAAG